MDKAIPILVALVSGLAGCASDSKSPGGADGGGLDSGSPGAGGGTSSPEGSAVPEGGGALVHRDRSHLTDTGTAPLDFSDPSLWLCLPGATPNECLTNLDATESLKDGSKQLVRHVPAKSPAFDCFYVYPTVNLSGSGNTKDFHDITPMLDPLLSQGARFTRICEVYAPLYRQISLSVGTPAASGDGGARDGGGSVGLGGGADNALAYGDVEKAFQYYLDHLNKGRKFVLIGHSQGTFHLTTLIQNLIDKDAALRAKMISALLIGGSVSVPVGKAVGGSFQNIPLCTSAGETGCVIAYNSFSKDAPPPSNTLFGRAPSATPRQLRADQVL